MNKSEYQNYLLSREWRALRDKVHRRCHGICERCKNALAAHVHHLTYERVGDEALDDLQAVCKDCHEFLHGFSTFDPAEGKFLGKKGVEESEAEEAKVKKYGIFVDGQFYFGDMALYKYRMMK